MRNSLMLAFALGLGMFAAPAFAGDILVERSTVTANGTLSGKQEANAFGRNSIAQAGTASVQAAGDARVRILNSDVHVLGTVNNRGENLAYARATSSIAQAGVASLQAASLCNCDGN